MTAIETRPDGRHERGHRTRAAILAAHQALIQAGEVAPTTARIAERAGVGQRTLFAHFPDLETLFAATTEAVYERVRSLQRPVDPSLSLPERTDEFLTVREEIYRYLTPFSLAVRVREQSSSVLRERRAAMGQLSMADVGDTFATELAGAPDYDDALAGLESIVTWASWYHLSQELDLGPAAARRIMRGLVLQILGPRP
ncbi:MAG: TetR/AcrR family transcriptional regulator [Mycobacteriales bacterium]